MSIDFDIAGARKAGATDEQISEYLNNKYKVDFDIAGARKAGATDEQIMEYVSKTYSTPVKKKDDTPKNQNGNSGSGNGGSNGNSNSQSKEDKHKDFLSPSKNKPTSKIPIYQIKQDSYNPLGIGSSVPKNKQQQQTGEISFSNNKNDNILGKGSTYEQPKNTPKKIDNPYPSTQELIQKSGGFGSDNTTQVKEDVQKQATINEKIEKGELKTEKQTKEDKEKAEDDKIKTTAEDNLINESSMFGNFDENGRPNHLQNILDNFNENMQEDMSSRLTPLDNEIWTNTKEIGRINTDLATLEKEFANKTISENTYKIKKNLYAKQITALEIKNLDCVKQRNAGIETEIKQLQQYLAYGKTKDNSFGNLLKQQAAVMQGSGYGVDVTAERPLTDIERTNAENQLKLLKKQIGLFSDNVKLNEAIESFEGEMPKIANAENVADRFKVLYAKKYKELQLLIQKSEEEGKAGVSSGGNWFERGREFVADAMAQDFTNNQQSKAGYENVLRQKLIDDKTAKKIYALQDELNTLSTIIAIDRYPQQGKKEGWQTFKNEFTQAFVPTKQGQITTTAEHAANVQKIIGETGAFEGENVSGKMINDTKHSYTQSFATSMSFMADLIVAQGFISLATGGIGTIANATSKISAIANLLNNSSKIQSLKNTTQFLNFLYTQNNTTLGKLIRGAGNAVKEGIKFEASGQLLKGSLGEEITFGSGALGNIFEKTADLFLKKIGINTKGVFKHIQDVFARGLAETSQEFGETFGNALNGKDFDEALKEIKAQFGDKDDLTHFVASCVLMGVAFSGAGKIGKAGNLAIAGNFQGIVNALRTDGTITDKQISDAEKIVAKLVGLNNVATEEVLKNGYAVNNTVIEEVATNPENITGEVGGESVTVVSMDENNALVLIGQEVQLVPKNEVTITVNSGASTLNKDKVEIANKLNHGEKLSALEETFYNNFKEEIDQLLVGSNPEYKYVATYEYEGKTYLESDSGNIVNADGSKLSSSMQNEVRKNHEIKQVTKPNSDNNTPNNNNAPNNDATPPNNINIEAPDDDIVVTNTERQIEHNGVSYTVDNSGVMTDSEGNLVPLEQQEEIVNNGTEMHPQSQQNSDIEAKKADIEKRRQEDIDRVHHAFGNDEFLKNLPANQIPNLIQANIDEINAKYDAELAELEKQQTNETATTKSNDTGKGQDNGAGVAGTQQESTGDKQGNGTTMSNGQDTKQETDKKREIKGEQFYKDKFLDRKGIKDVSKLTDEQKQELNKEFAQSEEWKEADAEQRHITSVKIWANGIAQKQMLEGKITEEEAIAKIENAGLKVEDTNFYTAKAEIEKSNKKGQDKKAQNANSRFSKKPASTDTPKPVNKNVLTQPTIDKANALTETLNEDTKKAKDKYALSQDMVSVGDLLVIKAENGFGDVMFNVIDKNGNTPKGMSANWRTGAVVDTDLKEFSKGDTQAKEKNTTLENKNNQNEQPRQQQGRQTDLFGQTETQTTANTGGNSSVQQNIQDNKREKTERGSGNVEGNRQRPRTKRLVKGTPKGRRKIKNPDYLKALKHEVADPFDMVLQAFIGGAKVHSSVIKALYRNSKGEVKNRIHFLDNKNGYDTIDAFAHSLWENQPNAEQFTTEDFVGAIEDVIGSYNGTGAMVESLNSRYKTDEELQQEEIQKAKEYEEYLRVTENAEQYTEEDNNNRIDYWESLTDEDIVEMEKAKDAILQMQVEDYFREQEQLSKEQETKSENVRFQVEAWHGSPHDIQDGFKTDKIGTGEGNQAFGWGLYFTSLKEIAKTYADKLRPNVLLIDGKTYDEVREEIDNPVISWIEVYVRDGLNKTQILNKLNDQLKDKEWLSKNTWV